MSDWGVTEAEAQWLRAVRGHAGEVLQGEALRQLLGRDEPPEAPPIGAEGESAAYVLHDNGPVVCYWQVKVGVVPGFTDPQATRQFCMTAAELNELDDAGRRARFRQLAAYAQAYFEAVVDPDRTNWAALEWFWL